MFYMCMTSKDDDDDVKNLFITSSLTVICFMVYCSQFGKSYLTQLNDFQWKKFFELKKKNQKNH